LQNSENVSEIIDKSSAKPQERIQFSSSKAAVMFVSVVFLFIFLLKFIQIATNHFKMYKTVRSMPGPKEFSLIGVAFKLTDFDAVFKFVMELTDLFGSPVKFWYGPSSLVVIVDTPQDMKVVLNSEDCLDKAQFYEFLNIGKALLVADKETWRNHFKIISKAYHKNFLDSSVAAIDEEAGKMVEYLQSKVGGGEFDVLQKVIESVLDLIFENFLDTKWDEKTRNEHIDDAKR
jgi:cytochrome P450